MEERVGLWWHRFVSRMARRDYPAHGVRLCDVERLVGVFFRALGGSGGLRIAAASARAHGARRNWRERIAGLGERTEFAWRDAETFYLPETIAAFPSFERNRDLYLWLTALAGTADETSGEWFWRNQQGTAIVLDRWPGLTGRYHALVEAHLALRPDPARLPVDEASRELAIRQALLAPATCECLPAAKRAPFPVPLWLYPQGCDAVAQGGSNRDTAAAPGSATQQPRSRRRHRAQSTQMPDGRAGLLLHRSEALFALGDYFRAQRGTEEDAAPTGQGAEDLDVLTIARDDAAVAGRVRFDLDLPAAENDDAPAGPGISLPEWDWRRQALRKDYCRLHPLVAIRAPDAELPAELRIAARKLRRQFEALATARAWRHADRDGTEPDLEALIRHRVDRVRGSRISEPGVYRSVVRGRRDFSCLLLADLSLSTDAWVANSARVIDVIRDALFLFAEALSATGDRYALYGFSSRNRDHVRFHHIKDFAERYDRKVRGRIAAVKPGFYTRMGAAIRHASDILAGEHARSRVLLMLTDGKPNDLDLYEGRYGVEDTRHAVCAARRRGLIPFCVTIDDEGATYLPHVFGAGRYTILRRATDLPRQLPQLYAKMTEGG